MKLLSLGGVALAGLTENGGVAALVVRKKAAAHKGKKSVAGLNLKKSHASKKFIDEWHPKMSFVQYKRQDCTNGMHALKVALPCVKADVGSETLANSLKSTLEDFYKADADKNATRVYSPTACGADVADFAQNKFPEMHAILTLAEAGGQVSIQLDMAAEMCSKNKDCGGFVQINMDQAAALPANGLPVKIMESDGSYAAANDPDNQNANAPTTYDGKGAMAGDLVFLTSSPECATKLFLNANPDALCESWNGGGAFPKAYNAMSNDEKITFEQKRCHSACVRASHCKEDPKENTYIKKRIIMSEFGSATETANTANDMFEGMTPAP